MSLSRRTLIAFREFLVSWTLREIRDVFDGAGIAPDLTHQTDVSGERRTLVEQHYVTLDLRNPQDQRRLLEAFRDILSRATGEEAETLLTPLKRDGYRFQNGELLPDSGVVSGADLEHMAASMDAAHLRDYIDRIKAFTNSDPTLAIGAAKELVEACCKTILHARGKPVEGAPTLPQLARLAAAELQLLPGNVHEQAKGASVIRRSLSNLLSVVDGIGELRRLYGSGHGRDGRWRGVTPRHARLVVGAAATVSTFLLETHLAREPWADPTKVDGRYITPGFDDSKSGAEISLAELADGSIEAQGFAVWVNPAQPRDLRSAHTGQFHGKISPADAELHVVDGECELSITRQGTTLIVKEAGPCGGVNVSFAGEYERTGPPQFIR